MKRRLIFIAAVCFAALEAHWGEPREVILEWVLAERNRQNAMWGGHAHDARHTEWDWLFILAKHLGKMAGDIAQPTDRTARMVQDSIQYVGKDAAGLIDLPPDER